MALGPPVYNFNVWLISYCPKIQQGRLKNSSFNVINLETFKGKEVLI